MDRATREFVRRRAEGVCEYCRLPQHALPVSDFHIEHVTARQHGGPDDEGNLAVACERCNLYKGPNLSAIDPETRQVVPLFHPRRDSWDAHFEVRGVAIVGLTPTGRATAALLNMNAPARLRLRASLPPPPPP
jgi:hypothetical protein